MRKRLLHIAMISFFLFGGLSDKYIDKNATKDKEQDYNVVALVLKDEHPKPIMPKDAFSMQVVLNKKPGILKRDSSIFMHHPNTNNFVLNSDLIQNDKIGFFKKVRLLSKEFFNNKNIKKETKNKKFDKKKQEKIEDGKSEKRYSKEFLMGQFRIAKHSDFVPINKRYTGRRTVFYMQKEAYLAYKKMYRAARKDGIKLRVLSATRSFSKQKKIWENKWRGKKPVEGKNLARTMPDKAHRACKILEYSSMPGTSRHHWGTDIDLNAFNNKYFEEGKGEKVYQWLTENAAKYGFYQPYTAKDSERPDGYEEEKWHWSYLPLAKEMLEAYKQQLSDQHIAKSKFKGAETAPKIKVVEKYVLGIHPNCK